MPPCGRPLLQCRVLQVRGEEDQNEEERAKFFVVVLLANLGTERIALKSLEYQGVSKNGLQGTGSMGWYEQPEELFGIRKRLLPVVLERFLLEQGAAHRALAQVHEASGQRTEARATYQASLDVFEHIQSLGELGQTLLAYGRFRLADDRAEGQRLVARARGIFAEIGATGWSAEAAALEGGAR